jgi:hypothetical protein
MCRQWLSSTPTPWLSSSFTAPVLKWKKAVLPSSHVFRNLSSRRYLTWNQGQRPCHPQTITRRDQVPTKPSGIVQLLYVQLYSGPWQGTALCACAFRIHTVHVISPKSLSHCHCRTPSRAPTQSPKAGPVLPELIEFSCMRESHRSPGQSECTSLVMSFSMLSYCRLPLKARVRTHTEEP